MKNNKYLLVSMSMSIVLMIFLMLILMSYVITPVFSYHQNDTFIANVTVQNTPPTVHDVIFDDDDGTANEITLSSGGLIWVSCNATIVDENGWQDVGTNGSVNATFYHHTVNATDSDDTNTHYTNTSCTFIGGSGNNVTAVCRVQMEHEALNGTWTCNITAIDNSGGTGSNTDTATVNQLIALSIAETNINFGNMNPGEKTADGSAKDINITNEGNVKIDLKMKANSDMICDNLGSIGPGNISYAVTNVGYDSGAKLNNDLSFTSLTTFNLGVEGIITSDTQPATNLTYWGINIPYGVRGVCNNTITLSAIISSD